MSNKNKISNAKKRFQIWGWRQGRKINTKLHELSYFFWETTLRCNLNCRHCGSDCGMDKKYEELNGEKVLEVFRDIANKYDPKKIMIAVTGGEPLVREDLFDILSEIRKMGFPWGMVTNGMIVNEAIVKKCEDTGMKTVSVSLDGIGSTHNWLRNNDYSYEKAVGALKLFVEKGSFNAVEAITCVNEKNINQLEEIYEMLQGIGVEGWRLFTIFPKGRAEINEEVLVSKTLLVKLFNFIKEKRNSDSHMHISYSEEGYLGCEWEREVRDEFFYCGAGIHIAGLLADGTYSACPSLSREWAQGHVDELPFSKAWENRYNNMRNRNWMKTYQCSHCKEWKNCNGSSLHLWNWKDGRNLICHYNLLNSSK